MTAKNWLSRKEASAFLTEQGFPIAPGTLARLAARKKGPPYRRFMWRVTSYDKGELLAWAQGETTEVRSKATASRR